MTLKFYYWWFIALLIALVGIGYYNITHNSLTSDEPAYLGAAYAYTQGVGLNPEHPLILKLFNSLLFWLKFPQLHVDLPNPHQLDSRAIRLAAFDAGYQLLMYFPDTFDSLVQSSRWLYFGVNSLLFLWLGIYSFGFKLLHPQIALIFATLWIFSPSFASHQSLIAFDVALAVTALMTILTTAIALYSVIQGQGKYLAWQFLILTISLSLAINIKFSNLLLLPLVLISLGITSVYLIQQKSPLTRKFIGFSLGSLLLQPLIILGMYRLAFAAEIDQSLGAIFQRYLTGLEMTMITAKGEQVPFLWGAFQPVNYGQYISKIFGYKENPVLFLLIGIMIWALFRYAKKQKTHDQGLSFLSFKGLIRAKLMSKPFLWLMAVSLLIAAYPLLYFGLAKSSRFVIGYRYFYPVLLFGYFLLTILLVILKAYYPQKLLILGLLLYSLAGAIAVPQTLSYVNPFWLGEKWLLANDSTLNWGQENRTIVQYLLQNQLLPKYNQNSFIHRTFNVAVNVNQYLELLPKQENYELDSQSYYQQAAFEPLQNSITQLPHRYLLIDSSVKQTLYAQRQQSVIAAQNWQYLVTHTPVYSHNDIIFLYQLHPSS